jgi:hypothetical protein
VTSASHDLALAWHPVLRSELLALSLFLSLDVILHTNTELITAGSPLYRYRDMVVILQDL